MYSGREGWYFGPGIPIPRQRVDIRDDSVPPGYSSCAASKAAGRVNGVSKLSKIVMIKASMKLADTIWSFAKVLEDVVVKGRQDKVVLLYPRLSIRTFSPRSDLGTAWNHIKLIMEGLFLAGVVIVTCAGDDARSPPTRANSIPNRVPAVLASKEFPVIVAGAVTNKGSFATFSRGISVSEDIAWAPGDKVLCTGYRPTWSQEGRSTGFAAGMVGIRAASFSNSTRSQTLGVG